MCSCSFPAQSDRTHCEILQPSYPGELMQINMRLVHAPQARPGLIMTRAHSGKSYLRCSWLAATTHAKLHCGPKPRRM